MFRLRRPLVILLLVLGPAIRSAAAQTTRAQTWEYFGAGQWRQSAAPATTQPVEVPALDAVERDLDQRHFKAAEKASIAWALANKEHLQRDRGLYLIARSLMGRGDYIKAFYYLDELMDTYPESTWFARAIQLQFDIADALLDGYRRRFLGMPIVGGEEDGIEMLFRVQNRSPGSPVAEQALLRTGDFYFANRDYDFAEDAYAHYLNQYPRSPSIPQVRLRRALSSLAQFRGVEFDATPLVDAREQLRAVMVMHPELAEQESIPQMLQRIDRSLAAKLVATGDFYRRTRQPGAAVYTYRYLVSVYPGTPEAAAARAQLAGMPSSALQEPEPGMASQDLPGPATAPSGLASPPPQ
jgi:outer membrane assembly lipoprotein YfiO